MPAAPMLRYSSADTASSRAQGSRNSSASIMWSPSASRVWNQGDGGITACTTDFQDENWLTMTLPASGLRGPRQCVASTILVEILPGDSCWRLSLKGCLLLGFRVCTTPFRPALTNFRASIRLPSTIESPPPFLVLCNSSGSGGWYTTWLQQLYANSTRKIGRHRLTSAVTDTALRRCLCKS